MRFRHAPEATEPGTTATVPAAPAAQAPDAGSRDLVRRVITIVLVLIALVLVYLAASAWIPRWWAHRMGGAINGQLSTGALLGICFGIVFTILPLGLLWLTMHRPMRWKTRVMWLALAVILAAPNLMTLGVAIGGGGGAHAGQRTMDVQAPMFRGATAIGALIAIVVFIALVVVYRRRPRQPRQPKAPAAA
ncbi:heme/copper-type cytochrome/quinol oxidase subunit 2 [Catenulispora sp. GP43]|uniref:permease n=1 Tax=Catenulispora sp. GP43 TaxID=3156263 RepID=UPI003511331C